jgi:hypothetical protein
MGYIGGAVAASAAAAQQKKRRRMRLEKEEESMTTYGQDELQGDWEFKIVRSESGAFRKPQVLSQLVEEEAQAGWVLLEKFDDNRVRFKRPRNARARDIYLPEGVDPYRTRYDAFSSQSVALAVMVGLLMVGALAFGLLLLVGLR